MESLKHIKNRMKTIDTIIKATNAMKMVSTVKLSKIGKRHDSFKESADILLDMIDIAGREALFEQSLDPDFWLLRSSGKTLILVLSTDQGFCGSFNQSIIECYRQTIKAYPGAFVETFGKKCSNIPQYIADLKTNRSIENRFNINEFSKVLADLVFEYVVYHDVYNVIVISGEFKNVLVQKGKTTQIFPIKNEGKSVEDQYTEVEGNKGKFIEEAFSMYLFKLFNAMVKEHIVAELSARTMAMDNSVKNAKDMFAKLSVLYNRIRQAKITQELTDIVSSLECAQ